MDGASQFQGRFAGLTAADTISLSGVAYDSASYQTLSATTGNLVLSLGGTAVGSIGFNGDYAPNSFNVTSTKVGSATVTSIAASGAAPTRVAYTDTTANTQGADATTFYSGPVNYLQWQYIWNSADGVAMAGQVDNMFLHGGAGSDALAAHGGSNVLDGGTGSNFLVGGTGADGGTDTFFVDGRASTVSDVNGRPITWDTLVNFHHGDVLTMFGFTAGVSTSPLSDGEGAPGYTGATIHSELGGAGTGVNGSVTFAGISLAQAQANFTFTYGTTNTGDNYMKVTYTGNG